jgi:hypothetical protein
MRWVMVITLLIISSDVFSQVRGTTWGDSWEQVEKTIKDELEFKNSVLRTLGIDKTEFTDRLVEYTFYQFTNGDTTQVTYQFLDENLVGIDIFYVPPMISINKFQDIADLLSMKYGDPIDNNFNNEISEAVDILNAKEDWIYLIYFNGETSLSLAMGYRKNTPSLSINYSAQLYLEAVIKEKEKAKLNDF